MWNKPQRLGLIFLTWIHWRLNWNGTSLQWADSEDEIWLWWCSLWWSLFFVILLSYCFPYRLTSELQHCLLLSSSQRLRKCFDGDSTTGRLWKIVSLLHHGSLCCQGKVTGRWLQVWEVLRSLSRSFIQILKGDSLFFNGRWFQPGGEINDFVSYIQHPAWSILPCILPPPIKSFILSDDTM